MSTQIFEMGKALLPLEDVLLIAEKESLTEIEMKEYLKGVKTTHFQLNKVVIEQAIQGSKPAQDIAINLLDNLKMEGHGV